MLCTRAYRKYPGLYDVMFLGGSIQGPNGESDKAFIRHFTLAGVEQNNIDAFLKRFMATAVWPK